MLDDIDKIMLRNLFKTPMGWLLWTCVVGLWVWIIWGFDIIRWYMGTPY